MWDCQKLDNGSYVLERDPSVICFDREEDAKWAWFATLAFIMVLIFTIIPLKLLYNLNNEPKESVYEKELYKKHLGFLYLMYKDEFYYWEPVVEMSRKWFLVLFSTFMPTAGWQAGMDITITCVYWLIHAIYLPYKTNMEDTNGNPVDPDLENNYQHFMFAIQIALIVAMVVYGDYEENPTTGTAVLLTIYFAGVACLLYFFIRFYYRRWRIERESVPTEDDSDVGIGTQMVMMSLENAAE
jgi:hypothetical protein